MKANNKKRNTILSIACLVALFVLLGLVPQLFGNYFTTILRLSAIYAVCALSMNLVNGFTGMFNLGTGGFMSVGAYVTVLLSMSQAAKERVFYLKPIQSWLGSIQIPFVAALIIGGLLAALVAFLIGFPVLRLRGDYLAIASLGFAEIIRIVFTNTQTITNGSLGIKNIPSDVDLYWAFGVLVLAAAFLVILMKTSYGRALKAIREDEVAAEAMGIGLFKHKMIALVLSGFIAGIGGGLLASHTGTINPLMFRYTMTYTILLMVVLGGQGSITGSIVGAFVVTLAQEFLRVVDGPIPWLFGYKGISGMRMVVFSILLMVVILWWRRGIFGTNEFSWDKFFGFFTKLFRRNRNNQIKAGGEAS